MKPVKFRGHNAIFAEDQPEYQSLPARVFEDEVTTVWELSDEELELIAKTKKVRLSMLTFGQPLQPVSVGVLQEYEQY